MWVVFAYVVFGVRCVACGVSGGAWPSQALCSLCIFHFGGNSSYGGLRSRRRSVRTIRKTLFPYASSRWMRRHPLRARRATWAHGAGYQARSISILSRRNDLAELREHIKYELRRGNITAEKAITLNHLIDEIDREATVDMTVKQVAAQQQALADLAQSQARLNETLADTIKLVEVLGSVSSPEFAGTLIAAKIQVVRLLAEKAAVDGSIDEIRQSMKRPKAG